MHSNRLCFAAALIGVASAVPLTSAPASQPTFIAPIHFIKGVPAIAGEPDAPALTADPTSTGVFSYIGSSIEDGTTFAETATLSLFPTAYTGQLVVTAYVDGQSVAEATEIETCNYLSTTTTVVTPTPTASGTASPTPFTVTAVTGPCTAVYVGTEGGSVVSTTTTASEVTSLAAAAVYDGSSGFIYASTAFASPTARA